MSVGIDSLLKSRKDNLEFIRDQEIDPYPSSFRPTHFSANLKQEFDSKIGPGVHTNEAVVIAGRVMAKRSFGKLNFVLLQDKVGRIQVVVSESEGGIELINHVDVGDFLGIDGTIMKTKRGELSVLAKKITFLSKALNPFPEKWHGLTNIETRYRKRALDLIMNPEIKDVFVKRAKIISLIREFLGNQEFLEVETPLLQPTYGGANARPFVTQSHAWNSDYYLSISPELYLKRLIIGGFDRVFTICKNFRNEDTDRTHNPEFTMMECYASYWDYNDVMTFMENLLAFVLMQLQGTTKVIYEGKELDFKVPWTRITMYQSLKDAGIDVENLSDEQMKKLLSENNLDVNPFKRGLAIAELFGHFCEPNLIQPTFVIDHPKETTPLCKAKRENPALIERFEGFVNGWELSNAYSELNDAEMQAFLFKEQSDQGRSKDETHPPDDDFVDSMGYGMPPTGGLGIGVDRFVMLLTNSPSIRDVILFPQMRKG